MRSFFTVVSCKSKTVKNRNAKLANAAAVTYGPHAAPGNLMRFQAAPKTEGKIPKRGGAKTDGFQPP